MSIATVTSFRLGKRTNRVYAISKTKRIYCFTGHVFRDHDDAKRFCMKVHSAGMKINTAHWTKVNGPVQPSSGV